MGLWLGYLLHQAMGVWLDGVWVSVGFGGATLVAVAAFWIVFRKLERGRAASELEAPGRRGIFARGRARPAATGTVDGVHRAISPVCSAKSARRFDRAGPLTGAYPWGPPAPAQIPSRRIRRTA